MLKINIRYDKRDAVHGVSYSIGDGEGWTPVTGRKKKRFVPLHLLHPPHLEVNLMSCETDSDCSDSGLVISNHATVNFSIVDGKSAQDVQGVEPPLLPILEPN